MPEEWTVERAGTTYGPVSWDEVAAWARSGHLGPTDVLRRTSESAAHVAGDVPGLLPAAASATGLSATSVAVSTVWAVGLVLVAVSTLAVVLTIRAIGDPGDETTVITGSEAAPTLAPTATDRPPDDTLNPDSTVHPDSTLSTADPSAYLGSWTGFYWTEPASVTADQNFWKPSYSHRITFEVAETPGDLADGTDLRVWGDVYLDLPSFRPFEGAVVRIQGDGSIAFSIAWAHGSGDGESAALHFTGHRSGNNIEGTLMGSRLDTGSTVTGNWQVALMDG